MKRKYGWFASLPDINDAYHRPPVMADTPPSVDLRGFCPPPYDQGSIGSCVAQALAGLLEVREMRGVRPFCTPSRLFVYYNARAIHGTTQSDSGSTMRAGVTGLERYGHCHEANWPYDRTGWRNKPTQDCYRTARKVTGAVRVAQDVSQFRATLASGLPFVFGFTVYESFESNEVKASGILPMPKPGESMRGGHAICAVGYDETSLLIRNSWGEGWGQHGYFHMPYDYALNTSLASDFWTIP